MSGAASALAELRGAVRASLTPIAETVLSVRHTQATFNDANDLSPAIAAAAHLILACEALSTKAQEAEQACRTKLAAIMADCGALSFDAGTHIVSVREAPGSVIITNEAAIPPELMVTPKAHPDKRAIGKLLSKGQQIEGAVLTNGGRPTLSISMKRI